MGKYVRRAGYEVFVSGLNTTVEEWRRALKAPNSELPALNAEQKEAARRFGISEEEYARSYLAGLYGQDRMIDRGFELGKAVEGILSDVEPGYQLKAVIAEMMKERWVVRIQTPQQIVNVAVPRDLADDIIDSDTVQDREKLRVLLMSSFELIGRK